MTKLEEKEKEFATKAHHGQKRKYTNEDYIVHPAAVVDIVRSVPHTEEMLAAAWLHDTVEDCGVLISEIKDGFGPLVARFVLDLTDISKPTDGNRRMRKDIDLHHTAAAHPKAKTIKLADLIDNTRSIVQYDPKFAVTYLKEKRALLGVLREGDKTLWDRAAKIAGLEK
jgi:(p)ppGpp synthase/HD superfamily hydrolase